MDVEYGLLLYDDGVYACRHLKCIKKYGPNKYVSVKWKGSLVRATLLYSGNLKTCSNLKANLAQRLPRVVLRPLEYFETGGTDISHNVPITRDLETFEFSDQNLEVFGNISYQTSVSNDLQPMEISENYVEPGVADSSCDMSVGNDLQLMVASEYDLDYVEPDGSNASIDVSLSNGVSTSFDVCTNCSYVVGDMNAHQAICSYKQSNTENTLDNENGLNILQKIEQYSPPKNSQAIETTIPDSKTTVKKYFCFYCKQLYVKLPLHLEKVHKDEEDVKKFVSLPKGSKERKKIIDVIRKKGCFQFNTDLKLNNGQLIVTRRPKQNIKKATSDYKVCPSCKGMFSKFTIRKHFHRCIPNFKKGDRTINILGKRVYNDVHEKACPILRDQIFPLLRNDEVTNAIRYDSLIIAYGNSLCSKYRLHHLHKMIRSKLRLLGRFLIQLKKIDGSVTDFACTFVPQRFDYVISAVNKLAFLDDSEQVYKSPATAFAVGSTLKKCGKLLITHCIKNGNHQKKTEVEDFLKVLEEEFSTSVNRTVMENQLQQKRKKKIVLPSKKNVALFNKYLETNLQKYFQELQNTFNLQTWKELSSYTLIAIQTFNRKRAGEVERITIVDFNTYQSIDENNDPDLFHSLSVDCQESAKNYIRFVIRGKKARGVPVLLSKFLFNCVTLILKFRSQAGVSEKNPYIFGVPGKLSTHTHLRACDLMRRFALESGVPQPELLRGTQLRKQIATQSAILDLNEHEITDLANFLGHADKVHKEHYRLPVVSREISRISRLLEIGVGKDCTSEETEVDNEIAMDTEVIASTSKDCMSDPVVAKGFELTEDLSDTEPHDSWSNEECNETEYGRARCVSPNVIKRNSWSSPEREVAGDHFKEHIYVGDLPSLEECASIIKENPILQNRTPPQLKAWVNNQIKKKSTKCTNKRDYWTSEEKKIMTAEFKINLKDGILPGLRKCEQILNKYPVLQGRTAVKMKAWVYNTIKKNKRV